MDETSHGSFDLSSKTLSIPQGLSQGEYTLTFILKSKDTKITGSSTGTVVFSVEHISLEQPN